SKKDGRDAHPTITIKIVSYLIRDPKLSRSNSALSELYHSQQLLQHTYPCDPYHTAVKIEKYCRNVNHIEPHLGQLEF
ncbi:hypothetical protein, partial [Microcoleus sp. AT13-A6]|uniref:hypothetical protein n=1 Tax=Microcoleus sp. AT13-A6 TaxID=2818591 RepID=UPI002FD0E8A5